MALFTSRKQLQGITLSFQKDLLIIKLADGKELAYPLTWHPELTNASQEDLNDWKVKDDGSGIRWNKLNVEINL